MGLREDAHAITDLACAVRLFPPPFERSLEVLLPAPIDVVNCCYFVVIVASWIVTPKLRKSMEVTGSSLGAKDGKKEEKEEQEGRAAIAHSENELPRASAP